MSLVTGTVGRGRVCIGWSCIDINALSDHEYSLGIEAGAAFSTGRQALGRANVIRRTRRDVRVEDDGMFEEIEDADGTCDWRGKREIGYA